MALTRKMLEAMSIESEKIDQIIEQHSETVEALKQQRDEYQSSAGELEQAKKRLAEVEQTLEVLEPYKGRYEETLKELNALKDSLEKDKEHARREGLYRDLLKDSGVADKRIDSILKVTDIDSLKIAEDGTLANSEDLKLAISQEWSDFIPSTEIRGANVETPPAGGVKEMTKEQILAIEDKAKRQEAIAENHEMFGF